MRKGLGTMQTLMRQYPLVFEEYEQWGEDNFEELLDGTERDLYAFFDSYELFGNVMPLQPDVWTWTVITFFNHPRRIQSSGKFFDSRNSAEKALFMTCAHEINGLIARKRELGQ